LHVSLHSVALIDISANFITQIPVLLQSASESQNRMHLEIEGWPSFVRMHASPGWQAAVEHSPPFFTGPAGAQNRLPI
jgi:hypothetical protein